MAILQTPLRLSTLRYVASFLEYGLSACLIRFTTFPKQTYLILLLISSLGFTISRAQTYQTTDQQAAQIDSTNGYWRLNTQAATRSTRVQFFSPDSRLLYEEILPGKWVSLNRKTQRQFDKLLAQLISNQLVSSRIKTETLPPTPLELPKSGLTVTPDNPTNSPMPASYKVHAYVSQSGKLYLVIDNPDRFRYKIKIIDQRNRSLYEEFANLDQYRRRLDVSSLSVDSYQIVIQIGNEPFVYKIKQQTSKTAYSLYPIVAKKQPDSSELNTPHSQIPPAKLDL
ncbi:hypothetical protein GCM10028807_59530 [Spirosoma daeguense]